MRKPPGPSRDRVAPGVVFGVALLFRLLQLAHLDSQDHNEGYDPSTYFTAADGLLHGRMPYTAGLAFLHPPGIALVGVPFALLGHLTTARTGFLLACAFSCVLGSAVAAGTVRLAMTWGAPRAAAVVAGFLQAVWIQAITPDAVFRLEPLGNALLVLALLALGAGRETRRTRLLLAGVALGLLVNVKIWWFPTVVVLLALIAWRTRRVRSALVLLATAALVAVVVDLPFLLGSRGGMWHAVLFVQAGRSDRQDTPISVFERLPVLFRLDLVSGVAAVAGRFTTAVRVFEGAPVRVAMLAVCAALVATSLLALRTALGRLAVPLLAVHVAVLLASPIVYPYYGDLLTVPLGLVLAAAGTALARSSRSPLLLAPWPVAALAGYLVVVTAPGLPSTAVHLPDLPRLTAAVPAHGCVVADNPQLLIDLDVVDRSFSGGCPDIVDVKALAYGAGPDRAARIDERTPDRAWRVEMFRYLDSGDTLVLSDYNLRAFLGHRTLVRLLAGRPYVRSGDVVVYGPRRANP